MDASPEETARERAQLEFDAMQLLGRTSRWTGVQRDRNRERIESLESDLKETQRQRDTARRHLERARNRIEKKNERLQSAIKKRKEVRRQLRAERSRPWSRMRRRVSGLRKRIGRALGR